MRTRLGRLAHLGIVLILVFPSCTKKYITNPEQTYRMQEYFPLAEGNSWTYKLNALHNFSSEPTVDGDVNLGEPFIDVNNDEIFSQTEPYIDLNANGRYDSTDAFEDLNQNGVWDSILDTFIACDCPENHDLNHDGRYNGPCESWVPYVPFLDLNEDGDYDPPNGISNYGEPYLDLDGDGYWDVIINVPKNELLRVKFNLTRPDSLDLSTNVYLRSPRLSRPVDFPLTCWDSFYSLIVMQDEYSNDENGLRWWRHRYYYGRDYMGAISQPIIIAEPIMEMGQEVVNVRTLVVKHSFWSDTVSVEWRSRLEGIESVKTPAGLFRNCLKFKSSASNWPGYMQKFNGISYQWYAEGVGLVKSVGPGAYDEWILESALINGVEYPKEFP